uniref:NADH-ubiquinone oxidoreductase chain 5 n=1 Tax=Helorus sp. ZJUH_2016017 TaxID=2491159 RepID=A0A3S8V0V4_9HYME|nr:NADH dehydrogenase subunit 5 [Helorus sp. ZJUH_2016017]
MFLCLLSFFLLMMLFIIFFFWGSMLLFMNLFILLEWNLINFNSVNLSMMILLDFISMYFVSLVMFISSMIFLYSVGYMSHDKFIDRFYYLMILFIISMILMILSPNLITILLGWDGLGLISYCLVIYYQNFNSLKSGMVTIMINRIGDIGILMSLFLILFFGSFNMVFNFNNKLLIFLILLAIFTKSAQIPFSSWLPMAMSAPTPVSCLVHSSTLVTSGVYLMIRFNFSISNSSINWMILLLSMMTMVYFGVVANYEFDLKKIIALSTLSQLGLMMIILCLGNIKIGFYHLFIHAVFKSLLFMCSGMLIHLMMNFQDIRYMGGFIKFCPNLVMIFVVANFALMGIPFFSGFYSKDLILESVLFNKFNLVIMYMIYFSIGLTVCYSIRLIYYILIHNFNFLNFYFIKEDKIMLMSMMFLVFLSIFCGSLFGWLLNLNISVNFLSNKFKFMISFILLVGVLVGMMVSNFFYIFNQVKKIKSIINKMFLLNYLVFMNFNLFLNSSMKFYMNMEKGWMEIIEGKNFIKVFIKMNNFNELIYYLLFMFIYLFLFMFIYLLYY